MSPIRKISQKRLAKEFHGVMPSSTIKPARESKRDRNRQLVGMGVSRRDEDEVQNAALAEVAAYQEFVRGLACVVTGKLTDEWIGGVTWGRRARVEFAHIKGRGAYGGDLGNGVPLDASLHRFGAQCLHQLGEAAFEKLHRKALGGMTLRGIASQVQALYDKQKDRTL